MSYLFCNIISSSDYVDKRSGLSYSLWQKKIRNSTTVYLGNLSFYTTEDQIYELFSKCGPISKVVLGLNRKTKDPCGFAFVRFVSQSAAKRAVDLLNGSLLDYRQIRVDWDSGENIEHDSRRYGRGTHGLQWRDEFRTEYDSDRGGEGGGLDYSFSFQGRARRKRPLNSDKHWDKYGFLGKKKFYQFR